LDYLIFHFGIRERLSADILMGINDIVIANHFENQNANDKNKTKNQDEEPGSGIEKSVVAEECVDQDIDNDAATSSSLPNEGKLLMDATVAPQNIAYPTDLKLLNAAREKSEQLIDKLYKSLSIDIEKPRTYRQIARKEFLNTVRKKNKVVQRNLQS